MRPMKTLNAPTPDQIAAVILAGGRSQRMNGADKGLLLLHGQPLVRRVYDRLRPQLATIVINANRNAARYAELTGAPVIADDWDDYRGPLAGIDAGFRATQSDWLLAVPTDVPALPADLVIQLQAGTRTVAAYALIEGDALYPLCLLHRQLHDELRASIERGEYAMHRWLQRHKALAVPIHGWPQGPRNLNTPEALAEAGRR